MWPHFGHSSLRLRKYQQSSIVFPSSEQHRVVLINVTYISKVTIQMTKRERTIAVIKPFTLELFYQNNVSLVLVLAVVFNRLATCANV